MYPSFSQPILSRAHRIGLAIAAILLTALLALAAVVEPNPNGFGTHTQLGFSECFVVAQWGVRCPSCGMTTAWARLLDGDVRGAVTANAGGVVLCVLAVAMVPWLLATSATGRWWYLRPSISLVFPLFAVVALIMLFDWMRQTGLALLVEWIP